MKRCLLFYFGSIFQIRYMYFVPSFFLPFFYLFFFFCLVAVSIYDDTKPLIIKRRKRIIKIMSNAKIFCFLKKNVHNLSFKEIKF